MSVDFYPRSPCGERPRGQLPTTQPPYFYPRSPCGERPIAGLITSNGIKFLSTLSLRRATWLELFLYYQDNDFYPRSPCGERPEVSESVPLAEYFYPRSPCGERRVTVLGIQHKVGISIHALLAESDFTCMLLLVLILQFLSTLSLRRATVMNNIVFVPGKFLSTLSLRRATFGRIMSVSSGLNFYPRSPCGERRLGTVITYNTVAHFYPRSPCGERRLILGFFGLSA